MRKNTVKEIWDGGGYAINGWCSIPSSFSAEIMAHQGFDSITIDMQHGLVDYQTAVTMLQAISTTAVIPFTRVPWRDPARLMKVLDAGSYGIICPMINNADDAEALVAACKYPPRGFRSFGPIRAKYYGGGGTHGGGDYHQFADEETLVIPQIETREAIKNLDEILAVPGSAASTSARQTSLWPSVTSPAKVKASPRSKRRSPSFWRRRSDTASRPASTRTPSRRPSR